MEHAVAHILRQEDGTRCYHVLADHLRAVAETAAKFARPFCSEAWAEYIGLLHDLGKYHPDWQRYIHQDTDASDENRDSTKYRPTHSGAGALAALNKVNHHPVARTVAYCVAGHHAGLDDWHGGLDSRLCSTTEQQLYQAIAALPPVKEILQRPFPTTPPPMWKNGVQDTEHLHLWVRMLFSCLVDADFLDTEAFMNPSLAKERGRYPSLDDLRQRYDAFMAAKEAAAPNTPINSLRRTIRAQCIKKASLAPGFFSLTVPTGGGKTLASLGFALHHALAHGLNRIIYAIPYTSIIEQTAAIFRYGTDDPTDIARRIEQGEYLFGDAVLEHHSNLDPERETLRSRLASENWDAPVIVTTNVQLFESLFAAHPSSCRKLHNIARSIIILDEAQLLPPEHLRPILSVLRGLVKYFGVSVVLMTATQPALEGTIGASPATIEGFSAVTPLVDDPITLAKQFRRVTIHVPNTAAWEPTNWEALCKELCQHRQVLCIVNSRKDCRTLHKLMPPDTVHLSALMCPEDRSVQISRIKEALRDGKEVRVISTQLVEAGVDIDFPVVYRALAGLDSIAQAAGRCNREGKLIYGQVTVFIPPTRSPAGLLRKGEDTTRELLRQGNLLELSPPTFEQYFRMFYGRINSFDIAKFDEHLVRDAKKFAFQFKSFARDFCLIDGGNQLSIIVRYTNPRTGRSSVPLIEQLAEGHIDRYLLRQLQRFTVSLYRKEAEYAAKRGYIQLINGFWVQAIDQFYVPGIGVQLDDTQWFDYVV